MSDNKLQQIWSSAKTSEVLIERLKESDSLEYIDKNKIFSCTIYKEAWDEVEKTTGTLEKYTKEVYNKLSYLSYAPIIFISAKTGQRVDKIFDMINTVANNNAIRVSTSMLNQVINEAIAVVQPPTDKGRRLKILYATQASTKPPTPVIFVNSKKLFHFSY